MTDPAAKPMPSSVEEVARAEKAREAATSAPKPADPLAAQRERWRQQKQAQRSRKDELPAAGGPPSTGAVARPKVPTVDPRVIERLTRTLAKVEQHGGKVLATQIEGVVEGGYKAYPLSPAEKSGLEETSQLYVELRAQQLYEWLLSHPKVAQWLPEIVLGGYVLGLVVPRAVASIQDRRKLRAAEQAPATGPA